MALDSAELTILRDELLRVKLSGALSVGEGDQRVQFRSAADVDAALRDVERRLAGTTRNNHGTVTFRRSR